MHAPITLHHDTLSTRDLAKQTREYWLARRARKLGTATGGGRLAKFREISRYLGITVDDVIEDRVPSFVEAEYWFIMWNHSKVLCTYCGETTQRRDRTRDHVIPKAHGGRHLGRENLVPACRACNGRKADSSLLEFLIDDRGLAS